VSGGRYDFQGTSDAVSTTMVTDTHAHTHACIIHTHTYMHNTYTHACTHVSAHYIHTNVYTQIQKHKNIHIHAHT